MPTNTIVLISKLGISLPIYIAPSTSKDFANQKKMTIVVPIKPAIIFELKDKRKLAISLMM